MHSSDVEAALVKTISLLHQGKLATAVDHPDAKRFVIQFETASHQWRGPPNETLTPVVIDQLKREYIKLGWSARLDVHVCFPFFKFHTQPECRECMVVVSNILFRFTYSLLQNVRKSMNKIPANKNSATTLFQNMIRRGVLDHTCMNPQAKEYVPESFFLAANTIREDMRINLVKAIRAMIDVKLAQPCLGDHALHQESCVKLRTESTLPDKPSRKRESSVTRIRRYTKRNSKLNQSEPIYDGLFDFLKGSKVGTTEADALPHFNRGYIDPSNIASPTPSFALHCSVEIEQNMTTTQESSNNTPSAIVACTQVPQLSLEAVARRALASAVEESRKRMSFEEHARPSSTGSSSVPSLVSTPSHSPDLGSPFVLKEPVVMVPKQIETKPQTTSKFGSEHLKDLFKNVEDIMRVEAAALPQQQDGPTLKDLMKSVRAQIKRQRDDMKDIIAPSTIVHAATVVIPVVASLDDNFLDSSSDMVSHPEDLSLNDLYELLAEVEETPADEEQTRAEQSIAIDHFDYVLEEVPGTEFEAVSINVDVNALEEGVEIVSVEEIEDTGEIQFQEPKEDDPIFRAEEIDFLLKYQRSVNQDCNSITTKEYVQITKMHPEVFQSSFITNQDRVEFANFIHGIDVRKDTTTMVRSLKIQERFKNVRPIQRTETYLKMDYNTMDWSFSQKKTTLLKNGVLEDETSFGLPNRTPIFVPIRSFNF